MSSDEDRGPGRWVMAERKIIHVDGPPEIHGGMTMRRRVERVFSPGDTAPAGHEARPYTRFVPDDPIPRVDIGETITEGRQEQPAQDRMERGKGAKNRKRKGE